MAELWSINSEQASVTIPFHLENQDIIWFKQIISIMGSKYNQIRCVLIFFLTFFSCFFFNRYDNLGSSTGSDTPLLEVSYKLGVGELGSYKVLGDDILNRVGHPTSPLCPTSLSQMRLQMRTGNTSTSSVRSCSLREISLTTLVQWSASYKILIMAHDRMPSSFGAVTRFGSARWCARKFCYMNIIENSAPVVFSIRSHCFF